MFVFSQESKGVSHETIWGESMPGGEYKCKGKVRITVTWSGTSHDVSIAGAEQGRKKSEWTGARLYGYCADLDLYSELEGKLGGF